MAINMSSINWSNEVPTDTEQLLRNKYHFYINKFTKFQYIQILSLIRKFIFKDQGEK
jgi:hypothetical protein